MVVQRGAVEADAALDDAEMLRAGLHLRDIVGVVLGTGAGHGEADAAVVHAHVVAHFAAQQLVHGQPGGLARDVPQGHLDGADRAAPRLEAAQPSDALHDALDVGRVLAQDVGLVEFDMRLEVVLRVFGLAPAGDALVGRDADDRILPDDGTADIGDVQREGLAAVCRFDGTGFGGREPVVSQRWVRDGFACR